MLLVARRKQQLNTEMGRKHISGDVGLMTFDKDSQSPSLLFLWTSRDVFSMLSKWIWHQSVRAGWDGNGSQVPIVASYDLIVSVIDWKISWHTIGLHTVRRRFEFCPPTPVICNLWSMDRLGLSITRKYKFIFMAKVRLLVCSASEGKLEAEKKKWKVLWHFSKKEFDP